MKMKIGVCAKPEYASLIKNKGFDYIEVPLDYITGLRDDEFADTVNHLEELGMPVPAGNFFFPSDLKVVGPEVDEKAVASYCRKAIARCSAIGIRMITVGSGRSRYCPDGFSKDTAVSQFGKWLEYIADIADSSMTVVIEPIRHQATNILNTVEECRSLKCAVDNPKVMLMADFQQMSAQGDDFRSIQEDVVHVHISNSRTLACPCSDDEDNYDGFFNVLRSIGYRGYISVETVQYGESLSPAYIRTKIKQIGMGGENE